MLFTAALAKQPFGVGLETDLVRSRCARSSRFIRYALDCEYIGSEYHEPPVGLATMCSALVSVRAIILHRQRRERQRISRATTPSY